MLSALLFALLLNAHDLGDHALIPLRDGFVIAWSDGPRIYAEHLDANLQATNAPFSFPLVAPSSVTSLALASNGANVLVTWHELRAGNVAAQYAAILDVDARSMLYGPLFIAPGTQPAAAGVKNGTYRLVAGGQVWTLDDRLGIESVEILPDGVVAAFSAAGELGTAKTTKSVSCSSRGGFSPTMIVTSCDFDETVAFTAPAGRSGFDYQWHTVTMGTGAQKVPVSSSGSDPLLQSLLLAPNGDGFAGAAIAPGTSSVCDVREGGRAWTVPRPLLAIGGNGADVLAVWRDSSGLRATFLGNEPFTLSDDGDIPKIVPAGSTTFVVLYRRGSSLVAQKILSQAPPRRAVR